MTTRKLTPERRKEWETGFKVMRMEGLFDFVESQFEDALHDLNLADQEIAKLRGLVNHLQNVLHDYAMYSKTDWIKEDQGKAAHKAMQLKPEEYNGNV